MKVEKLLAKFGLTAIRYGDGSGGKGLLSLDEQLAAMGIVWHASNTGFLLLLAECNDDRAALTDLMHLVFQQAAQLLADNWDGFYPQQAVTALCVTAVAIAMHQQGRNCPECDGTGKVKMPKWRRIIKCQCCKGEGIVPWDNETIFAAFSEQLPVTPKRFIAYNDYIETLVYWLAGQKTAAVLLLEERMRQERREARLVA